MGCDIHLHIELKINGNWENYSATSVPRNYQLFGLMAGVRDRGIEPISQPKGLPDDISLITKLHYDSYGAYSHSPSWLNENEIKILKERASKEIDLENFLSFEHNFLSDTFIFGYYICSEEERAKEFYDDIRFVFWFDS